MKKINATFLLILFSIISISANTNLDLKKSQIEWVGKKITGSHNGTIQISSGNLEVKSNEIISGEFIIDMSSIVCSDIEDEKYNLKFLDHLKSDDFFSVEQYPTSKLVIKKGVILKENKNGWTHNIYADLTIKGITKEVVFPCKIVVNRNDIVSAFAEFTVDRTQYGIEYKSSSFFPNIADKAIDNEMYFKVNLYTK